VTARVLETVLTGRDLLSRVAESASASAAVQSRSHARAAESATASARVQQAATSAMVRSNGLLGTSLTPVAAGLGAVGLAIGYAAYKGMTFDTAMSRVQAATQASAGDMGRLREAAITMGADTQFSSTEAAAGITELAKAGVSAKDVLGGGLKGALDLAAAGEMEVADAAEIGATALNVFNLEGNRMSHVADLLAAGAGKAQGSVHDMGMALNQSALVAQATGLSIEETTGTLAAFASQGLIGSDAGTSFRSMLLHLQNPSKESAARMAELGVSMYDANGAFVGMESLAGQLQTKLSGLTQAERDKTMATIFGSDAVRAANVLYEQGSKGIAEWTAKVDDSGYAAKQAAQLTDNLGGDLEKLGGAVDSFFTSAGEGAQGPLRLLVQAFTEIVNAGGDLLGFINDLPGPVTVALAALAGVHLLGGPLANTVKGISFAFDVMRASAVNAGGAMGALKGAGSGLLGVFGGPWGLAITGVAVGLSLLVSWLGKSDDAANAASDAQMGLKSALEASKGALDANVRAAAAKAAQDEGLLDAADLAGISLSQVTDAILGQGNAYSEVMSSLVGYRDQHTSLTGEQTEGANAARRAIDALQGLAGQTEGNIASSRQLAVATGETGAAMAGATVLTEEAAKAQEEWFKATQGVLEGYVEPLSVYKGLLEEKTTADRESAEKQAAATEDSADSWEDFTRNVSVSLDEYAAKLEEKVTNQQNWRDNIVRVTQWAGAEVGQILLDMGEEGVDIVAKMADGGSAESRRLAAALVADARAGGEGATQALKDELAVMAIVGAKGANATRSGIARELGIGVGEVQRIANQYGINLASGINPILRSLGKAQVVMNQQAGRTYAGVTKYADGGFEDHSAQIAAAGGPLRVWAEPETDGEAYIPLAASKRPQSLNIWRETGRRLNAPEAEFFAAGGIRAEDGSTVNSNFYSKLGPDISMAEDGSLVRTSSYYRASGTGAGPNSFGSPSDVPRPRSTAPYRPPISTAADAAMEKAYGDAVDWLKANLAPELGPGIGSEAMMAALRVRFPGLPLHSGYRPGAITATGNASYHGMNRAVDIPPSLEVNRWIYDNYKSQTKELILSLAGAKQVHNGADHVYTGITRAMHFDHNHWAMANGGIIGEPVVGMGLRSGDSYSFGERGPERVVPMGAAAAMPGYGTGGHGGGSGQVVVVEKRTTITVDASNRDHRSIATAISVQTREDEWLANG
jgi:TP901 family phage tail tape measure protein